MNLILTGLTGLTGLKILDFRFEIFDCRGSIKAESLSHTSVGQGTESRRPTSRGVKNSRLKALRITGLIMRKGFALESFSIPLRRALPYASMRKGFALGEALSPC